MKRYESTASEHDAGATYGNLPVLDSTLLATLVFRPVGDVTECVDVLLALYLQILVDGDTLVVLEFEARVGEETRRRLNTGSHDEQCAFEGTSILEND